MSGNPGRGGSPFRSRHASRRSRTVRSTLSAAVAVVLTFAYVPVAAHAEGDDAAPGAGQNVEVVEPLDEGSGSSTTDPKELDGQSPDGQNSGGETTGDDGSGDDGTDGAALNSTFKANSVGKSAPAPAKTKITIIKTVDGKNAGKGFTFNETKLEGGTDVSPVSQDTNPQGKTGEFTVHAPTGATATVTFTESLNKNGNLKAGTYPLNSVACYWGKKLDTSAEELTVNGLTDDSFTIVIPDVGEENKQDVTCAVDNTFVPEAKQDTPKTDEPKTDEPKSEDSPKGDDQSSGTESSTPRTLTSTPATSPNPTIPPTCGLNMVLTFDVSSSTKDSIGDMKTAGKAFVDALAGTGGQIAINSFALNNYEGISFTGLNQAGVNSLKSTITGLETKTGNFEQYTNWERGLNGAKALVDARPNNGLGTVVVFITDGDPNRTAASATNKTGEEDYDASANAAVPSANAIKAVPARVFALKVGGDSNAQIARIQKISGSTQFTGNNSFLNSDYMRIADYGKLKSALEGIAQDLCGGTVSITKQLKKLDNSTVAQGNINFTASTTAGSLDKTSANTNTSGNAEFKVTLPNPNTTATITLTEKTTSEDFELESVVCTNTTITPDQSRSWTVSLTNKDSVKCTVTNKEIQKYGFLTLNKVVVNQEGGLNKTPHDFKLIATPADGGNAVINANPTNGANNSGATATTQVLPGSYVLSEVGLPGYTPGDWTCKDTETKQSVPVTTSKGTSTVAVAAKQEVSCSITNTEHSAKLTLKKIVTNLNSQSDVASDFKLIATPEGGGAAVISETASQNQSSDRKTGQTRTTQVPSGTYVLSEEMANGSAVSSDKYVVRDWTCTANGVDLPVSNSKVTIADGSNVLCTLENVDKKAEQTTNIVIQKLLSGEPAKQGFDFAGTAVNGAAQALQMTPGTHPTDGNGRAGEFTVKSSKDDTVVATFTESKNGYGDVPDVDFVIDGVQCWYGAPNDLKPNDLLDYKKLTEITGVTVNGRSSFTVSIPQMDNKNKQQVLCEVNNVPPTGTLTLTKNVVNDNGGTATAHDFTLSAGTFSAAPAVGEDSVTFTVPEGSYKLGESGPTGYQAGEWSCTIGGQNYSLNKGSVSVGFKQSINCAITNTALPGTLKLIKHVDNKNGGTATAGDFTLRAGEHSAKPNTTDLDGSVTFTVDAGSYKLGESGPAGYTAGDWSCLSGNTEVALRDGKVTVANGQWVNCEITNTDQPGTLILTKRVLNNSGGSSLASDVTLRAGSLYATPASRTADGSVTFMVKAGTYLLGEDSPAGYQPGEWTCDSNKRAVALVDGTVRVNNGQVVNCEITNDDIAPVLTLFKSVVNTNGGAADPSDFTLSATDGNGTAVIAETPAAAQAVQPTSSNAETWYTKSHDVSAGTYTLSESGPTGYEQDGKWMCMSDGVDVPVTQEDGSTTATVTLALGQVVDCGIVNKDIKTNLLITKQARGNAELIGNDQFRVTYDVTVVANGTFSRTYTLTDELGLDPAAVIDSVGAQGPEGIVVNEGFDGVTDTLLASDATIAGGGTHVYTVTVTFTIPKAERTDFPRQCVEGNLPGSGGAINTATYTSGDDTASATACANIPEPITVDLGLTKTALIADGNPAIDVGDHFTYNLEVTNHGETIAYEAVVTDKLPAYLTTVLSEANLPAGWTASSEEDGTLTFTSDAGLAPGATVTISFEVTFDPPMAVDGEYLNSFDAIHNEACVASGYTDSNMENNCSGVDTNVKQIDPNAQIRCYADAPYVDYNVIGKNFDIVAGQTLTMKWFSQATGELLYQSEVTVPDSGELSGTVLWPGATVNEDGISVSWPGWRPAAAGETPTFLNLVLDKSLDSYKFREPLRLEFSINPSASVSVLYPDAEVNCELDRQSDITLLKEASVEFTAPGGTFDYTLTAGNAGLGALNNVRITDEIPADVSITGIEFDESAFPTWQDCSITGDTNGYGGVLECTLNGTAAPNSQLPVITLHALVSPDAQGGSVVNNAEVCGTSTSTTATGEDCDQDSATVAVRTSGTLGEDITPPVKEPTSGVKDSEVVAPGLASTGTSLTLAYLASFLTLVGLVSVVTTRRPRGKRERI